MTDKTLSGRTALVTGASSGLGVDFAHELASRGARVVLVARREDRLREVQQAIRAGYGVEASTVTLDLGTPEAPQALYDLLKAQHLPVDILVNNAGFGLYGRFTDLTWERQRQMLALNMTTLTHLTHLFARDMVKAGWGRILQVSSIGAFQPSPGYGAYSATKSYVLSFGEALNYELRGSGVTCTVVCPGVTATEFLEVSGQASKKSWYQKATMMGSREVALIGVNAMLRGQSSIVTGFFNWLAAFFTRFTPRPLLARIAFLAMKG